MTLGFGAADRHSDHPRRVRPARHRPGAQRAGRGQLHRQVRHQDPRPPPACPRTGCGVLVDVEALRCSAHYRQMITTAWQLGGNRHDSRFRAWAHMLGYGGHFLTKSRRYSVTFGQLRQARTDHRRQLRPPGADRDSWGRPLDETVVLVLPKHWTYAGIGHTADLAQLALAAAARAREHRGQADAIRCQPLPTKGGTIAGQYRLRMTACGQSKTCPSISAFRCRRCTGGVGTAAARPATGRPTPAVPARGSRSPGCGTSHDRAAR